MRDLIRHAPLSLEKAAKSQSEKLAPFWIAPVLACVTHILLRERLEGDHKASHSGQGSRREEFVDETLFAVDGFEPKPENSEPRDNLDKQSKSCRAPF
jgi:hypothetical protein